MDTGTIAGWLLGGREFWENADTHEFPEFGADDVRLSAVKFPAGTLNITVVGPFGRAVEFNRPAPAVTQDRHGRPGIHVAVRWGGKLGRQADLLLNGELAQSREIPPESDA